jgi:hypothetical protein
LFDEVKKCFNSKVDSYIIYGHSAGSQFAHRFAYFVADAKFRMAIIANAGWYTLPDFSSAFPYGIKNSPMQSSDIVAVLSKPIYVLLGDADTDPNHKSLRTAPEAMLQGPHRFARGHYYEYAKQIADKHEVPFKW